MSWHCSEDVNFHKKYYFENDNRGFSTLDLWKTISFQSFNVNNKLRYLLGNTFYWYFQCNNELVCSFWGDCVDNLWHLLWKNVKKCFYINIKVGNVKVVKTLRFFSGSSSKTNVQHIWGCCLDFDPRHSADRNADSERVQQQLMQLKSLFPNTGKILKCKRKNCLCYCLLWQLINDCNLLKQLSTCYCNYQKVFNEKSQVSNLVHLQKKQS